MALTFAQQEKVDAALAVLGNATKILTAATVQFNIAKANRDKSVSAYNECKARRDAATGYFAMNAACHITVFNNLSAESGKWITQTTLKSKLVDTARKNVIEAQKSLDMIQQEIGESIELDPEVKAAKAAAAAATKLAEEAAAHKRELDVKQQKLVTYVVIAIVSVVLVVVLLKVFKVI